MLPLVTGMGVITVARPRARPLGTIFPQISWHMAAGRRFNHNLRKPLGLHPGNDPSPKEQVDTYILGQKHVYTFTHVCLDVCANTRFCVFVQLV